jgi:cysteine-rich repeat protein
MRTPLHVVLAAASVIAALAASPTPAAVYFVDGACATSGTGAGLACGASGPFRTIGEGVDAMHAGDTLNIRGPHDAFDGIYREGVYLTNTRPAGIPHGHALDCRASACTLQGYNGERPVVQGARVHPDWVADGGGVYHRTMEAAAEDAGAEDPAHLRLDTNGPRDPYNLFTTHPPTGADAPEGNVELPYSLRGDNDTAPSVGYWSYDTATQTVYVNPPGGDDPNTTILVPFLYNALLLAAPTANVTVQDLDFGWTRMMAADVGRDDSAAVKPNLVFRRDHFKHYRQKGMIGHLDTNILVEDCSFQYCGRGISFNSASGETCYGMRLFGASGGIVRKTPTGPVTYQYLGTAGSWRFFTATPGTLPFSWGDAPWNDPRHTYATTRGHGIDLKQTNGNATHDVGSGFTVDHIEAAQVQSQVLFFDTSTDGLVDGAYIHECGQAWVMGNYTPQAPALYGSNHVVRNSIFRNTGGSQGNLSTTYVCGTDRSQRQPGEEDLPLVQFVNNFFVNSGWAALEVAGNASGGNCANQTTDPDNVVIVHNTFTGAWTNPDAHCGVGDVGCRQVVLRDVCVPGSNCTHGVTFTNNILDHPTDEALVLSTTALANTTLDYELFGSASACPSCNGVVCDGTNLLIREGATIPAMGSPYPPTGGTCETLGTFKRTHGTQEVHGSAGTPAFVTATDPHLTAGSAAINRGTAAGVTMDIDGQVRDALPDIGADEYVGGGVTTTSSTTTLRATTTTTATTTTSTTTLRATTTTATTTTLRATTTSTSTSSTSTPPSTVTTTTLAAAICGNGIVEPGEQCDDGNTTPLDGCDGSCQLEEIASTPAGTLLSKTFNPPTDAIAATLTSPQTGPLTIIETSATTSPPPGVIFAPRQVHVEAPPTSAQSPLGLVFTVDGTLFLTPHALSALAVYRDGVAVAPCSTSPWQAVPDPCLSGTVVQNRRQVKVTLMTSSAGDWNFATGTVNRCLAGTQLMLADPAGRAAGRRFLVRSNDTSQLVLGDGASEDVAGLIAQGGSLTVVAVGGDGFETTYALPATGWRVLRARNPRYGVRYRNPRGPINTVVFKHGRLLQVTGTGPQLVQSLGSEPAMVEVDLLIGRYQYLLAFGSGAAHQFKANKRLVLRGATQPGLCSATPAVAERSAIVP